MKRWIVVTMLWVGLGSAAHAQEPLTVFGIGFNQPLAMPECEWKTREKLRFSRKEPKAQENYYAGGWPKEGNCFERNLKNVGSPTPVNNETVSIKFPLMKEPELGRYVAARIVDGRIQRLWLTTGGISSQTRDFAMLKEKFGTPATLLTPTEQNMMGAKFDTIQAEWKLPGNITATYGSVISKVTEGTFILSTPEGDANYQSAMDAILNRGTKL